MEPNDITHRETCYKCLRPSSCCYCHLVQKVKTDIKFVILIHPLERKRKIATGRMAHLCLPDSVLIEGSDFSQNAQVNQIINDSNNFPMILYPGDEAINLSDQESLQKRSALFPKDKRLVLFVIDGTWSTAKKTMKLSQNLKSLQTVCFTPAAPSQFRIRKQPNELCYSTIEAIHKVLDLLDGVGSQVAQGESNHDVLLKVFLNMVETQIEYMGPDA